MTVTRREGTLHSVKFDRLQFVCVVSDVSEGECFHVVLQRQDYVDERSPEIRAKSAANPMIITVSLRDVAMPPPGRHTFELEFENGSRERLCATGVLETPNLQRLYA